jgi:hypothetical protein
MSSLEPGITGRKRLGASRKRIRPQKAQAPLTISVPEAGRRYFNLSKNASYDAAARNEIPTIRVGRLLRVPVRAMERMLDEAGKADVAES